MATIEEQRTMIAIQQLNRKVPEVTLRDLFAMNSLNALLQKPIESFETVAEQSYRLADAMLEARQKK